MEKRQDRRVPSKDPVAFEANAGPGEGTIINLSVNGCAFQSGYAIDPNTTLQLELCIPNEKDPVKVSRARLAWTAGSMMGVEFMNMTGTSKARLQQYIDGLPQESPS